MPEAVIVATARSPIGRAFKGSLTRPRPDDLTATIVAAALDKVPAARPRRHRRPDARLRPARRRAGLQHGPGRRRAARLRPPARHAPSPGTARPRCRPPGWRSTRSRPARATCSSRPASSASPASRDGQLRRLAGHAEPGLRRAPRPGPRAARRGRRAGLARPARGRRRPRRLHRDGPDRGEPGPAASGITRAGQDEFGVRSQNLAEKAIANGFWEREITPVTLPDGTVVSADDGPRAGVTLEAVSGLKPVFRPDGTVTAGNCCPLNDGAAAVVVMSDTKAAELGITPLARIVVHRRDRAVPGDHGPRPGRGVPAGARPGRDDHRRHRPGRDQRGVRRPGHPVLPATSASTWTSSTSTAARSRSATRSA